MKKYMSVILILMCVLNVSSQITLICGEALEDNFRLYDSCTIISYLNSSNALVTGTVKDLVTKNYETFPIDLNTLDDEDRHPIADATEVYNIFGTALATKKGYLDSGTALKDLIMACSDEAAVALIIDNR